MNFEWLDLQEGEELFGVTTSFIWGHTPKIKHVYVVREYENFITVKVVCYSGGEFISTISKAALYCGEEQIDGIRASMVVAA